jgi:hypothetical protein
MRFFCVECGKDTEHTKRSKARNNKYEFIIVGCEQCNGLMCKCEHCDYCRGFKGNKVPSRTRKIVGTHVKQCERNREQINAEECGATVAESTSMLSQSIGETMAESTTMFSYSVGENNDDFPEAGTCDGYDGGEGNDNQSQFSIPKFAIPATDQYVRMEIDMYHQHEELLGGFRSACWRSRYRNNLFGLDNIVDMNDAKFMFYVTSLNREHTDSMNDTLYKLLTAIELRHDISYMQDGVSVPTCKSDANRYVLKGEYAIMDLLPRPQMHVIAEHACFRLDEVLRLHLAMGRSIEFTVIPFPEPQFGEREMRTREEIHGCEAMDELLLSMNELNHNGRTDSSQSYFGYFTDWHDAFLRSYVKQKLNNVWMYMINVPESQLAKTSPYHTYCVAVGSGYLDHTPVLDWFAEQMEGLMKGNDMYCGRRHRTIHVKMGPVAHLADRPEKAFTLKTALLGTYGKVASWAADVDPKVLPDCDVCYRQRVKNLFDVGMDVRNVRGTCARCCQWDLTSTSQAVKKILPPPNYPTKTDEGAPLPANGREVGVKFIKPIPQSFEMLIASVNYAAYHVRFNLWNKGNMDAYLRTCAISKRVRDHLWSVIKQNQQDSTMVDDGEIDDGYNPLTDDSDDLMPKLWLSRLDINSFIDCGMHLIFHGILASVVEVLESFFADHKIFAAFERTVNVHLLEIQSMRLEWCKTKPVPKKQWLAENELGLARIIPFIYTTFFNQVEIPQRTNTNNRVLPRIITMIHSLHVMVCMLMSPRRNTETEIDNAVKLFLSSAHQFSKEYWNENVEPFWSRTGNYPTLLCLPAQQRRHGPVRWYWEGTSERYIQTLKKELTSMRRNPQYFGKKMVNLFTNNVLDWENERLFRENPLEKITSRPLRMYYQYPTWAEVNMKLRSGQVLSAFLHGNEADAKLMIAFGSKRRSGLVSLAAVTRTNDRQITSSIGLPYVRYELQKEECCNECLNLCGVEDNIRSYCLLLPYLHHGKDFNMQMAVVFDDWDIVSLNGEKVKMRPCKHVFNN